jgi:hypothetical protein
MASHCTGNHTGRYQHQPAPEHRPGRVALPQVRLATALRLPAAVSLLSMCLLDQVSVVTEMLHALSYCRYMIRGAKQSKHGHMLWAADELWAPGSKE